MNESKTLKNPSYDFVDLCKFLGSLFVVSIHTEIFKSFSETFNNYYANFPTRIAVYFFFIASSYFFFKGIIFEDRKIKKCKENSYKLKKYFVRMSILYIFWSFIFMISDIPMWYRENCLTIKNFIGFGLSCITSASHYHLWFLLGLIYTIPIMYFLLRFIDYKKLIIISCVFYAIGLLYGSYRIIPLPFTNIWDLIFTKWPRIMSSIFNIIPLCGFGIICDKINISNLSIKIITLLSFLLFTVESILLYVYTPNTASAFCIFTIPTVTFLFISTKNCKIKVKHNIIFRKLSTLIYCSHPLVMIIFKRFVDTKSMNSLLYFLCISVLTILFSLVIILLNRKFRKLKFLKYIM